MLNGNHEQPLDASIGDDGGDSLDAGLRAGFAAGPEHQRPNPPSVIARLRDRHGLGSPVLLQDDTAAGETIVRPRSGDDQTLGERYQVHGEIARGGMGIVLKGRDVDLGRDVAIKVLQDDLANDPAMVARFVEEAQIAGQLQHPGILPVYERGLQAGDTPYFVMKLIKGRTLGELMTEAHGDRHDRTRLLGIFQQVCQTIGYAHARGVVHRDLKPSNVLVGAFGEVQVVDWGLAKLIRRGGVEDDRNATRTMQTTIETVRSAKPGTASIAGSVMGTPAYMAPEQSRGDVASTDERTDVFALGAMLHEMLVGQAPSGGDPEINEPTVDRLMRDGIERELAEIASDCLRPAMRDRPRNAKVVADRIEAYLTSVESRAHASEVAAAEARARAVEERRRRRLTIGASLALLVAGAVIVFGAWTIHDGRQQQLRASTARLNEAVMRAGELLGVATTARLTDASAWTMLETARSKIEVAMSERVEPAAAAQAAVMLDRIAERSRERRLAELIEHVVIHGATHYDPTSWRRMEQQLREVLLDFDIDLLNMSPEEIARRIREDSGRIMLADCLELWIGTIGSLNSMGVANRPLSEFTMWVETLLAADPDPVRSRIRQLVHNTLYARQPVAVEEIDALFASLDLQEVHPRSLSWLATAYYATGQLERMIEVYREIAHAWPRDLMVLFDAGFLCTSLERWELAIRYYLRCISIDEGVAGIWRQLGVAYRHNGEHKAAIDALHTAVDLQPDHYPTHNDLAWSLLAAGRFDEALRAAEQAIDAGGSEDPITHAARGRALHMLGRWGDAISAYERAIQMRANNPTFNQPVADWLDACRAEAAATGQSDGK